MLRGLQRTSTVCANQPTRGMATAAPATVAVAFGDVAATYPHKDSIKHFVGRTPVYTHSELKEHVDAFACMLREQYFEGDKLATIMPNSAEHAIAQLGCARLNTTIVPIGVKQDNTAVAGALAKSGAKGLLVVDHQHGYDGITPLVELIPECYGEWNLQPLDSAEFPSLKWVFHTGFRDDQPKGPLLPMRDHLLYNEIAWHYLDKHTPADPSAVLIETPAGGSVTQGDAYKAASGLANTLKLSPDSRVLSTLSLSSVEGIVGSTFASAVSGACLVLPRGCEVAFNKDVVLETLGYEKPDFVNCTAEQLEAIVAGSSDTFPQVRGGLVTGLTEENSKTAAKTFPNAKFVKAAL